MSDGSAAGADFMGLGEADADGAGLKQRSVRGAGITALAQGLKFFVQFGTQIALARLLSPAQFGLVAMVAPLVGFVQLFADLGLVQATIQRPSLSHRDLTALFWVNAAASAALALLLVAVSPLAEWFYGEPRLLKLTACLALPLLLGGLAAQHMALMNRGMRFATLAAIDIGTTAAAAVAGIAAAAWGLGYWALVVMQMVNAVSLLAAAWACSGWRPSRPQFYAGLADLLRFGGNITGFNLVNYLSYNLDNILIGATAGRQALGLYNRAFRLLMPSVMQLSLPFTRVAVPLLSKLQSQPDRYRQAFLQMLCPMLLVATPGLVFCIVMANRLIVTLLGEAWAGAGPIFAWIGVSALLLPLNNAVGWLFISQGRARAQLACSFGTSGALLGSFMVGLPWGPVGVAAAASICVWVFNAPLVYGVVTRSGPVRLLDLARAGLPILAASLAAGLALFALSTHLTQGFFGLAEALALTYGISLSLLACLPGGRAMLADMRRLTGVVRGA